MRLYVAGPMTGLPDFNYPTFNAAANDLRRVGYDVLNPAEIEADNPTPGTPQAWDWYMRHALRMVLLADALAVLPDWHRSRGASLEVHIACSLGMNVQPVETWQRAGVRL